MKTSIKSRPTQMDIAKACGVSRSTVAAVLRDKPSTAVISDKTRQAVLDAVERLGYRPHSSARSLRSGRTHQLGLAVPTLSAVYGVVTSRILKGIGDEARRLGYNLSICSYDEDAPGQASLVNLLSESRFDGVFIYGDTQVGQDPREEILHDYQIPHVLLEKRSSGSPSLIFDNVGGSRRAVEHLIRLGRRRIAFVGPSRREMYLDRYAGYCAALHGAGLEVDAALVWDGGEEFTEEGYRAVDHFVGDDLEVDAIFCCADFAALACLQRLHDLGYRVPEDVGVIGFDDSPMAPLAIPPLTSVFQDGVEMGRRAVHMLLDQLADADQQPGNIMLPTRLVVRRSCGAERNFTSPQP